GRAAPPRRPRRGRRRRGPRSRHAAARPGGRALRSARHCRRRSPPDRPGAPRPGRRGQPRLASRILAVSKDRVRDEFLELARISSVSTREGNVAKRLTAILEAMGVSVQVDDAGDKVGSDTGNLVAHFPGTAPDVAPFLLWATWTPCRPPTTFVPSSTATGS